MCSSVELIGRSFFLSADRNRGLVNHEEAEESVTSFVRSYQDLLRAAYFGARR